MSDTPAFTALSAGYGARLRAARQALGMTARALAQECGASPQRWSHWEVERHPPDFHCMLALKHRRQISLDWVYAGDWRGLPAPVIQRLLNLALQPDASPQLVRFRAEFTAGPYQPGALAVHEERSRVKSG
jgi:DNA-binding XRE family transcriptional regulator